MAFEDIDATLVTVGQPVEGGCLWTDFSDSPTLPTSAAAELGEGMESLGELSQNGYTEGTSVTSTDHKGWHGKVLLSTVDEETRTYKMELSEISRPAVAKVRYGAANVTVDADGNVTKIVDAGVPRVSLPLVIDELESNGWLRRTVVQRAKITDIDDVGHQRDQLMVYGITFTVEEPASGDAIAIYRARPAASGGSGGSGSGD